MPDLARTFDALSDPTRLMLVDHLLQYGPAPAGDLVAITPLSAPAVSRHLKKLRAAGVVRQQVQGTHRIYSANPDAISAISEWAISRRDFWLGSLDRLARTLDETKE